MSDQIIVARSDALDSGTAYPRRRDAEPIGPGAILLRAFVAGAEISGLLDAIGDVAAQAPPRNMLTPGGRRMSVAMTNCGRAGWVSDTRGYCYSAVDPVTAQAWPAMPEPFSCVAHDAAAAAGFAGFEPDACLINFYAPGTRLSLHQDRDERDFTAPIVSVSLGLPATFLFGGPRRASRPGRHRLAHGDVAVWGGASRLYYHGVAPLEDGAHAALGARRINLTLRKAL
jgi:alkylated DNA repair protein (DNA oxidative demethylase)